MCAVCVCVLCYKLHSLCQTSAVEYAYVYVYVWINNANSHFYTIL